VPLPPVLDRSFYAAVVLVAGLCAIAPMPAPLAAAPPTRVVELTLISPAPTPAPAARSAPRYPRAAKTAPRPPPRSPATEAAAAPAAAASTPSPREFGLSLKAPVSSLPWSRVEHPPRLIDGAPRWTPARLALGVEGTVLLELMVGADGRVTDRAVVRSLHPELDEACREAALSLRFEPGRTRVEAVRTTAVPWRCRWVRPP